MWKPLLGGLIGLASGLVVGGAIGWCQGQRQTDAAILSTSLVHELEVAGLCADTLNVVRQGDGSKTVLLLENRLGASISQAQTRLSEGSRIPRTIPNLREAVRRAADYYLRQHPESMQASAADAVMARLQEKP